jgi:ABC-type lipoprotein release transport system permease subunit
MLFNNLYKVNSNILYYTFFKLNLSSTQHFFNKKTSYKIYNSNIKVKELENNNKIKNKIKRQEMSESHSSEPFIKYNQKNLNKL